MLIMHKRLFPEFNGVGSVLKEALMKRIVVAVEDDGLALSVVRIAGELARSLNARLTLCHVLSEEAYQESHTRLSRDLHKPFTAAQAQEHACQVAHRAAQGLKALELDYEVKGLVGPPVEQILQLCAQLKADLIVMGFEGLHGLGKLRALGSTSRAVMERAPCSVLIVPLLACEDVPAELPKEDACS